jgi:hypothetical protein
MDKQKIRLLRMGRLLTVPVKGEQVSIDIDEDFDLEDSDEKHLKVRCEGPNGLEAGSVIGMLQQLGLSVRFWSWPKKASCNPMISTT